MLIAQISDTHYLTNGDWLAGRLDTASAFARLINTIRQMPVQPDLILLSGDVGECAIDEEYQAVGAALRSLGIPTLIVPGNHDARAAMHRALPEMVGLTNFGHLCLLDERFDIAIIGLDTTEEGQPWGCLCPQRLQWLEQTLLKVQDRPVLIFMHHPPITTGLAAMDRIGLIEGKQRFGELLRQHGQVQAILCGHMHRRIQGSFASVPVTVAPSGSHQLAFDIRKNEPYRITDEPGQFMMHLWNEQDGLISHTLLVTVDS